MTVQDLDRLVTKTELNPVTKKALRAVRTAVMSGSVGEPEVNQLHWSIQMQTDGDYPARMTFSFRRG
jgi:hypothetical protein